MRIDLCFQEGKLCIDLFVGDLFVALLGPEPLVDHFNASAEYENEQEYGNIAGLEQRLLEIAGPAGRPKAWRRRLPAAKKIMVDTGKAAKENEQYQYDQSIGKEFFLIQPFGNEKERIEIIEGDQQAIGDNERDEEISFRKKRNFPGPWVEYKWHHEKADPGRDVNDDLYNPFLHIHLKSMGRGW